MTRSSCLLMRLLRDGRECLSEYLYWLFQLVITVSLETMKIMKNLTRLDIAVNQA